MNTSRPQHYHRWILLLLQGATLGTVGLLSTAMWGGNSRGLRRSRDLRDEIPVNEDERYIEPLGPNVPWGLLIEIGPHQSVEPPRRLTRQHILIGRAQGCDIPVEDERASRYHVIISWENGHAVVRDNNSTNGTLLNGQKLFSARPMSHADIIGVGNVNMQFLYSPESGLIENEAQPTEHFAIQGIPKPPEIGSKGLITTIHGPEAGRQWPVSGTLLTIGRGGDNYIVLPHASVSRHHAQLLVQPSGIYVQDIGSSNGTSVNGEQLVAPRLLRDGDRIQIGDVLLVVAFSSDAFSAQANSQRMRGGPSPEHTMPQPAMPPPGYPMPQPGMPPAGPPMPQPGMPPAGPPMPQPGMYPPGSSLPQPGFPQQGGPQQPGYLNYGPPPRTGRPGFDTTPPGPPLMPGQGPYSGPPSGIYPPVPPPNMPPMRSGAPPRITHPPQYAPRTRPNNPPPGSEETPPDEQRSVPRFRPPIDGNQGDV
jgi:pSer/pThr/pTyr-binding forkhead associated (FHA) protein